MMPVIGANPFSRGLRFGRDAGFRALAALVALGAAAALAAPLFAQQNPTSATNVFYGSVTSQPATDDILKLSLDDAVRRGLDNNLGVRKAVQLEKYVHGQEQEATQEFLPTITLEGDTGVHQYNLAALGFKTSLIGEFSSLFPGGKLPPGSFSEITRTTLTEGQLQYKQTLFSGPVIAGWKAARAAEKSYYFSKMSARGEVVQQVATAYLRALAASSEVDNAKALADADQVAFNNAHDQHVAGTASNLDELRARVQLQAQQQALISAQNEYDKDQILLKREIGIDPGQRIALTDPVPYSDLAEQTPEEVRAIAYKNRQDYQNLQNQIIEYRSLRNVYRAERLPTLSFSGNWGITDVGNVGSHGTMAAQGTLSIPLFREAGIRGNVDASQAQLDSVLQQFADLKAHIDQQVRSALLDVAANQKLVEVARSNVELATRALSDETDRVNSGVDDTLPLVTAQAALASAQSNLVESLYQYNVSKLALARAAGVEEQQYRVYLGK
jgi:outer membrane protein TolC